VIELNDATAAQCDAKKLAEDWKEVAKGMKGLEWEIRGGRRTLRHAWQHAAHLVVKLTPQKGPGGLGLQFLAFQA